MKKVRLMVGVMAAVLVSLATAQTGVAGMSSEQRLNDYAQLVNIIERHYGPLRWKQTTIQLDWKRTVDEFRGKVAAAKSDAEFYRVLAQFTAQLKDAHVGPIIPSTYRASLGFVSDYVQGKVLIETIDRLRLPELLFPFRKGDQVLAIGGQPVEAVIAEVMKVGDTGHEPANKRIGAARLTSRRESNGLAVPKGVTTVTVLPKGASQPVTVTVTWIVTGTPLIELDDLSGVVTSSGLSAVSKASDGESLLREVLKLPLFNLALPSATLDDLVRSGVGDMGGLKSTFTLPSDAVQYDDMPLTAAVYKVAGKRIGVLRIPSYAQEGMVETLARALSRMETETDVLVIDQANNPGGQVSQVSDIIALFADKSYKDMDFEIRPSLAWLKTFQDINVQIADMIKADPSDFTANALKARFDYLEAEMRDSLVGRRFLSNPVSLNLMGTFGMIQPSGAVRYSKPVLLLINELDFSGGDAFPALMKDNGRVKTFGMQTAGAGGNVREHGPLANSFFKLNLTESLMVRPNGEYVENRGVKADVEYDMTEDDFMNGQRGYVKAFTKEALKMVGVSDAEIEAALK